MSPQSRAAVVMGCALVADSGGAHYDVPRLKLRCETAGLSDNHEPSRASCDQFLDMCNQVWGAATGHVEEPHAAHTHV